jgi:hypothetical protein
MYIEEKLKTFHILYDTNQPPPQLHNLIYINNL